MPLQQLFVWFWPGMARRFPMHYHRLICGLLGIRLRVIGQPPRQGPVLIASNHVSWLDIVVLSAVAPLSFIAKREVGRWPFFGSLARLQRTVFVDRDRRHATGNARDEMRERLQGRRHPGAVSPRAPRATAAASCPSRAPSSVPPSIRASWSSR